MARPLKPLVRGGGYYPSSRWTPLVYPGGYTTMDGAGGGDEPIEKTVSGSIVSFSDAIAAPLQSLSVAIEPVQSGSGDPSPSNVRPISGRTSATVTRTGKNLFSGGMVHGTWANGTFYSHEGSSTKYFSSAKKIPVVGGETYSFSLSNDPANPWTFGNVQLFAQGTFVKYIFPQSGRTFVVPDGIDEIAIVGQLATAITTASDVSATDFQLELGSTASAYEPYQGNTYTIQLGDTVYGGTLDVTSGKMVVDRAIDTFTKDSVWYGFATGVGNSSAVVQLSMYQNCKYVDGASSYNGSISSTGVEAQNYWVGARQNEVPQGDMCFAYSTTGQVRFHRLDVASITDLASFKSAFPDTTICYYLATPIEITLTPTQIEMLLGENNLWADAGDSTLTYYAEGNASTSEALGILLGGTYNNPGGADDVSDDEALGILLGGS